MQSSRCWPLERILRNCDKWHALERLVKKPTSLTVVFFSLFGRCVAHSSIYEPHRGQFRVLGQDFLSMHSIFQTHREKKNILGRGNWPTRKLHLNAPGSLQRATCAQVEGGHAHSKIRVRGAWSTFSSIASADRGPIIITSSLRSSFSEQRIFFVNSKTFI